MASGQAERPNVVVILTDQQRWDSTGVHGNPLDLTPNFDAMARSGTHVAQAISPQPLCAPARAALQTGQYQTRTGCFRNQVPLPEQSRTLAHEFADAGYATGYIGKWHLAQADPVPTSQRGGYQSWLGANVLEFTSDAYHTMVFDDGDDPVFLPGYRSDALFDAAIRFVADHAGHRILAGGWDHRAVGDQGEQTAGEDTDGVSNGRPFYLFLSLIEPHHQNEVDAYPAPEGYEERYQGRWLPPDLAALDAGGGTAHRHIGGYWGQIRRVDEGLARFCDALRSLELADDTIVVFTSDHGSHFKTRNGEYKRSCHEASVRVPMALRGPGFDGGGRIERPVSLIDLPPTLLDAAGLDVPDHHQGRSFLPLVRDERAEWPAEAFIQISETEVGRAIRTSRWKYHVVAPEADPRADAMSDRYVEADLYDLTHDPYELVNLAGTASHRQVADELREQLIRRMVEAGEPEPVVEPAPEAAANSQRRVDPTVHAGGVKPTRFGHQG